MKRIVQIELTNVCNRRCAYCGIPIMKRKKGYMSLEVFDRCMWVLNQLGQDSVGLHHYGESTIHPDYVGRVRRANAAGVKPFIYTNGDLLTDELIAELAKCQLSSLTISGHMPRGPRQALWKKCVDAGISPAYWQVDMELENTIGLAGQVEGPMQDIGKEPLKDPEKHCRFLVEEQAIVLWNGDLVPCCVDYDGVGVFGNIMDEKVLELKTPAFKLCDTCPGHPGNVV